MKTQTTATEAIDALAHWSENFTHPTPFALFLDLIGWSEDTYGERLCGDRPPALGWVEASKLAAALDAWADHPREVEAAVAAIAELTDVPEPPSGEAAA